MTLSFYVISSHREFFNRKNSCVREELIDHRFFLQTQLQQITTVLNKNYEKARTELLKNREKNDLKNRNDKI